jgi:proline dehydrogenase
VSFSSFLERVFAKRWIAGARIIDAINDAKRFNRFGTTAIINYLGEEFRTQNDVENAVAVYLALVDSIKANRLKADISVKPTQLGLFISKDLFARSLHRIVRKAYSKDVFVWIDAEAPDTVESTMRAYLNEHIRSKHDIGICVQSYLKSSSDYLKQIVRANGIVRLVKGAYPLSRYTFSTKEEINKNYIRLMLYLFKHSKEFTIATHDLAIIEKALNLNGVYKRRVTYAMLNGVRNKVIKQLALQGESTSVYIPFGEEWISYSYRRLKEAGHLSIIIKSLFEDQGV